MNQTLINLVLALVTNELLHNVLEVKNIREKVKRLKAYTDKKPYKEMSMKIDTRAKSYGISTVAFLIFVLPLFGFYSVLDVSGDTALKLIVALLVVTYFTTAYSIDKYHVEIEQITKKFKK